MRVWTGYCKAQTPMTIKRVAVLGAGNGGCATAADLAVRGFETRLYSRSKKTLEPLRRRGGIELVEHGRETFGQPYLITSALEDAVPARTSSPSPPRPWPMSSWPGPWRRF